MPLLVLDGCIGKSEISLPVLIWLMWMVLLWNLHILLLLFTVMLLSLLLPLPVVLFFSATASVDGAAGIPISE